MSERSFGARLGNGKKLKSAIASFPAYVPTTGDKSPDDIAHDIVALEDMNGPINDANFIYREAVHARKGVFSNLPDSISLVLSPILGYVSGKFGKNSIQFNMVKSMVAKLRGQRLGVVSLNPTAITHSVSQMGFSSVYENFKSLVTTLSSFGDDYTPPNPNIGVDALFELAGNADLKNVNVNDAYDILAPLQEARVKAYDDFSVKCQCVKNFVKSQYTVKSIQFKLVKGLKI